MKYIDISMELNDRTVVWKEDPAPKLIPVCRIPQAPCNFTWLDFSAHAGTHVDAPYYLFPKRWTAEQIPLERLVGPCQVLDLTEVPETITTGDLRRHDITCQRLLLKTRNSLDTSGVYNPSHVDMEPEAARYLLSLGITTLGYDYQSFERAGLIEIHRILLERNVTLIDNLNLSKAAAGRYLLLCLPLKVTGIDAAPCRAILLEEGMVWPNFQR